MRWKWATVLAGLLVILMGAGWLGWQQFEVVRVENALHSANLRSALLADSSNYSGAQGFGSQSIQNVTVLDQKPHLFLPQSKLLLAYMHNGSRGLIELPLYQNVLFRATLQDKPVLTKVTELPNLENKQVSVSFLSFRTLG